MKLEYKIRTIITTIFIFAICLMFNVNIIYASDNMMEVHFIDVGQGLSILVKSDDDVMLYDGGNHSHSSNVVTYLKKQGITDIDYLISSHYDEDHVAGLVGCLNAFDVENVIGSDYEQDTKIYQSFIETVKANGLSIQYPEVGEEYQFGTGSFTILAPRTITGNDNDNSVAIKLSNGDNSFLFTGDAESNSELDMCNSGIDLSCDVLVAGHHGSATATTWDFLQLTVPEYAVISCGIDNKYGHPHKDTMDKFKSMDIQVLRTDIQGDIIAISDGVNITWNKAPCNNYSAGDSDDIGTQPQENEEIINEDYVWISSTGSKYHSKPDCGTMNPDKATQISQSDAEINGYEPCKKCY